MNEQNIALLRALHFELVKAAAHENTFTFAPEYVPLLAAAVGEALSSKSPSDTVVELNKRVTALQMRIARVRYVLQATRELTGDAAAVLGEVASALADDEGNL